MEACAGTAEKMSAAKSKTQLTKIERFSWIVRKPPRDKGDRPLENQAVAADVAQATPPQARVNGRKVNALVMLVERNATH
jgi:hypothetical protein